MADIDKLRAEYEKAMDAAHKLTNEKDEALQKLRERYSPRQRDANDRAAEAQKALCDAEAAAALVGQPDAEVIAANLGLTLPE